MKLITASERERAEAEDGLKESLDYFREQRRFPPLYFDYAESRSVTRNFNVLLETAKELKKDAPMTYHLVGALLKLRFPEKDIENKSYSTADAQQNRPVRLAREFGNSCDRCSNASCFQQVPA